MPPGPGHRSASSDSLHCRARFFIATFQSLPPPDTSHPAAIPAPSFPKCPRKLSQSPKLAPLSSTLSRDPLWPRQDALLSPPPWCQREGRAWGLGAVLSRGRSRGGGGCCRGSGGRDGRRHPLRGPELREALVLWGPPYTAGQVASLLAPRDLPANPPRRGSVPAAQSCPGKDKAPVLCSGGRLRASSTAQPSLPLRPALLNGYKLEDKSAGFQAILSSISGNCCSPSSCVRLEEERRKTPTLLGLSPAANKHAKGAFLLGSRRTGRGHKAGGPGAGAAASAGARPRQQLLFIEYLLCARHRKGCWSAGRWTAN